MAQTQVTVFSWVSIGKSPYAAGSLVDFGGGNAWYVPAIRTPGGGLAAIFVAVGPPAG